MQLPNSDHSIKKTKDVEKVDYFIYDLDNIKKKFVYIS